MAKIAIFTDLHFGENISGKMKEGINTHGDTFHLLEKMRDEIQGESEICINLGDLAFGCECESKLDAYTFLQDNFLLKLPFKIYHMLGNHEFFIATVEKIQKIIGPMQRHSFITGGVKHIILDIALSTNNLFGVSGNSVNWLISELNYEQEVIIYCHYPITQKSENVSYYHVEKPERAFLENSEELREIIKGTTCKYWISGHTHFDYKTEIDGIQHVTIPSFAEDNNGKPNGIYAVFDTETMFLELKHIT